MLNSTHQVPSRATGRPRKTIPRSLGSQLLALTEQSIVPTSSEADLDISSTPPMAPVNAYREADTHLTSGPPLTTVHSPAELSLHPPSSSPTVSVSSPGPWSALDGEKASAPPRSAGQWQLQTNAYNNLSSSPTGDNELSSPGTLCAFSAPDLLYLQRKRWRRRQLRQEQIHVNLLEMDLEAQRMQDRNAMKQIEIQRAQMTIGPRQ